MGQIEWENQEDVVLRKSILGSKCPEDAEMRQALEHPLDVVADGSDEGDLGTTNVRVMEVEHCKLFFKGFSGERYLP